MKRLPAPETPPDLAAVYVTNRSAGKYQQYVEAILPGPVRFVLENAPRKNLKRFPPECPKDTIALLEMMDGGGACVTMRDFQKPQVYEEPGKARRVFMAPVSKN